MTKYIVVYKDETKKRANIIKEYTNIFGKDVSRVVKRNVSRKVAEQYESGEKDYYSLFEYIKNTTQREGKNEKEVLEQLKNAYIAKESLVMIKDYLRENNKYADMSSFDIGILAESYEYGDDFKNGMKELYLDANEILEKITRATDRLEVAIMNLNKTKNELIRKNVITNEDMIKFETERDKGIRDVRRAFEKKLQEEENSKPAFSEEFRENFRKAAFNENENDKNNENDELIKNVQNEISDLNQNLKRDVKNKEITLDF